jgi:hypothetical protein
VDHITPLIRETNANLIDKTTLIINELLPKNQELLSKDINSNFKLLQSTILSETSKFLSSSLDKRTIAPLCMCTSLAFIVGTNGESEHASSPVLFCSQNGIVIIPVEHTIARSAVSMMRTQRTSGSPFPGLKATHPTVS